MAFDTTFRTEQEYLNNKAGFTGALRTKQECYNSLAGMTAQIINNPSSLGTALASYCGGQGSQQIRLNLKVGSTDNTLTKQEAIRRL